jgi:hypothetical protein
MLKHKGDRRTLGSSEDERDGVLGERGVWDRSS